MVDQPSSIFSGALGSAHEQQSRFWFRLVSELQGSPSVSNPFQEITWMLKKLGVSSDVFWSHRPIQEDLKGILVDWVLRRKEGYPLAYLLESWEFLGQEFVIRPGVLVPRPETELLVEKILMQIDPEKEWEILDLGAGSGVIGLSLAQRLPRSRVTLVEKSPLAFSVCEENVKKFGLSCRVNLVQDEVQHFLNEPGFLYDVIVFNPPYVAWGDPEVDPWVVRWEPKEAIFAEEDGLSVIKAWLFASWKSLKWGGWMGIEHGSSHGQRIKQEIHSQFTPNFFEPVFDYQNYWRHSLLQK